jgi:hypothetical protein
MKNIGKHNPPDLIEVVQAQLLKLIIRQLRFAPSAEDLPLVAEVFTEDLVRAGRTKHSRVIEAFEHIGGSCTDWPQPAKLLQVMGELGRQKSTYVALPAPEVNREKAEQNILKIKQMLAGVFDDGQTPQVKKHFNQDAHMASSAGTMQLEDEQWIEGRRIFKEALETKTLKKALKMQNAFFTKCLEKNSGVSKKT